MKLSRSPGFGEVNGGQAVSVIVIFNRDPAEDEYNEFLCGLEELCKDSGQGYKVTAVYKTALKGAAVTLPADKVSGLARLDLVQSVCPDKVITLDPVERRTDR